jgi:hypothetical protein
MDCPFGLICTSPTDCRCCKSAKLKRFAGLTVCACMMRDKGRRAKLRKMRDRPHCREIGITDRRISMPLQDVEPTITAICLCILFIVLIPFSCENCCRSLARRCTSTQIASRTEVAAMLKLLIAEVGYLQSILCETQVEGPANRTCRCATITKVFPSP